jgi:hypothetical protein
MAPVPVFHLLFLVRLREFVVLPVIFVKEAPPNRVFVIVPVVIVLVLAIVNANLYLGQLGRSRRDDGNRNRLRNGKKRPTEM